MANKKNREIYAQKEKIRQYNSACKPLKKFYITAAILTAISLLMFFVEFAYVFNTDINGAEVKVTGFNFMFSALSGKFTSTEKIYGDMAVPFYYYAQSYCDLIGTLVTISFFAILASLVLQVLTIFTKKHNLNFISSTLNITSSVLFVFIYIKALTMKYSQILPIYCSGNPACSIKSLAILPLIFIVAATVFSVISLLKYFKAKKTLK